MKTFFIGCLHFGDRNMAHYRGFQDGFHHDEHLIEQWNYVVTNKKDIVYILGDVTMEKSFWYYQLGRLNGIKHVILGNHDRRQDVPELLKYVQTVGGAVDWKGYLLTHVPIHPNEAVFYKANIHAHIHHVNKLEDVVVSNRYTDEGATQVNTLTKYINVDAKLIDFKPKTIEQLLEL